jgi:hypothetical protein
VYLQMCNSFVIFVHLNYIRICGIFQVYLVIGLSIQCVVFLVFGRLCYTCMCVLCQVYSYVERIFSFVCFYGLDMFFISEFKCASSLSCAFE